jgi:hypothetical protein
MVYLESMLTLILDYATDVKVLIVTDEATRLDVVLHTWGYTDGIATWQAPRVKDSHPYSLTWAHKKAIREEIAKGDFSSVVYMEDDTHLSWAALVSCAGYEGSRATGLYAVHISDRTES